MESKTTSVQVSAAAQRFQASGLVLDEPKVDLVEEASTLEDVRMRVNVVPRATK